MVPAREADGVEAPSRPSRFTREQSARGGRTTAARRNRTEHPDDAEDRIAREIMRGGPREPTYREDQANWQREARALGENPTEAEIEAAIGGWDAGQVGMLQRAREEVGLPRLRTDRESIATRRRDGADRSIRDEVAGTRAGAARGRLLEQLSDADLDAVERDAERENRDRGRGSNAPRDRAKRSAYEKRERIIRDVRNERQRRSAASADDDEESAPSANPATDSSAPATTSSSPTPTSSTSTTSGETSTPTTDYSPPEPRWRDRTSSYAEVVEKLRASEPVDTSKPGPTPLLAGLQAAVADGRTRYTDGPFPPPRGVKLGLTTEPPASGPYVEARPDGHLVRHDGEGGATEFEERMVAGFADTVLRADDVVDPVRGLNSDQLDRAWRASGVQLDDGHRRALTSYVDGSFSSINGALRGNQDPRDDVRDTIDRLDDALAQWRLPERTIVHRGVRTTGRDGRQSFPTENLAGKVLVDPGYLSTSPNERIVDRFDGAARMEIHLPPGTPAVSVNGAEITVGNADERELLLPRGLRLRVVSDGPDAEGKRRIVVHAEPDGVSDDELADDLVHVGEATRDRERYVPGTATAEPEPDPLDKLPPAARAAVEAARARRAAGVDRDDTSPAGLKRRLDALPPLPTDSQDVQKLTASALQQAQLRGTTMYIGLDYHGGKMDMWDREPSRAQLPMQIRVHPDGRIESSEQEGSVIEWTPEQYQNFLAPTVERMERKADATAAEPEPFPGDEGRAATTPAGHVESKGLREGTRAQAHAAMAAIAKVHRVDGMPKIQTATLDDATEQDGVFGTGLGAMLYSERGRNGQPTGWGEPLIGLKPDQPGQAFSFAHEYGHAIDYMGLRLGGVDDGGDPPAYATSRMLGSGAEAPDEHAAMSRALAAMRQTDTFRALAADGPHSDGDPDSVKGKYLAYLRSNVELWARAYSQFIATRSGDETVLEGLADRRRPGLGGPPTQWTDEEFAPIDAAIADVLRARGWMD